MHRPFNNVSFVPQMCAASNKQIQVRIFRELPFTFEAKKAMPQSSCSQMLEPKCGPMAILRCEFDNSNPSFSHEMTFNHSEPNLSDNELKLFTSDGSSPKIKSAALLSKIGAANFFGVRFFGAISIFLCSL